MSTNEKPASRIKLALRKFGRTARSTAIESAKLGVKVAFITVVAVSTVGALKKVATAE